MHANHNPKPKPIPAITQCAVIFFFSWGGGRGQFFPNGHVHVRMCMAIFQKATH